jgi:hypothetical protein
VVLTILDFRCKLATLNYDALYISYAIENNAMTRICVQLVQWSRYYKKFSHIPMLINNSRWRQSWICDQQMFLKVALNTNQPPLTW